MPSGFGWRSENGRRFSRSKTIIDIGEIKVLKVLKVSHRGLNVKSQAEIVVVA